MNRKVMTFIKINNERINGRTRNKKICMTGDLNYEFYAACFECQNNQGNGFRVFGEKLYE